LLQADVLFVTFLAALGIKRFSGMQQLGVEFTHAVRYKLTNTKICGVTQELHF